MLKLANNVKPAIAAFTAAGGFVMALPSHAETFVKEHPTLLLVLIRILVTLLVARGSVSTILPNMLKESKRRAFSSPHGPPTCRSSLLASCATDPARAARARCRRLPLASLFQRGRGRFRSSCA
mmetsp:Transcript_16090/g.36054  ORF Transcript_16090/g.36054 Transcript_16090/m.36054 type:complete len:124 (+) Transcript_16090:686-1057(+)